MAITLDPKSNARVMHSTHNSDICFEPHTGDAALDNQSVVVVGPWTDYTGSGGGNQKAIPLQGIANLLEGTEAALLGERFPGANVLGKDPQTNRLRQVVNYIEFKIPNARK